LLAVLFPLFVGLTALRSFNSIANPMARVMAAADAVADGDFSVRVPIIGQGEFARLASSFNRMVEELERSDRLRRNLTADVAHELRTPLHIIQGNLEGIQDGIYEPTQEQIGLLLDETHQLSRLVEDLRTLSLAEAGQLPLEKEDINVNELLNDVATSFSGQAEIAGVVLRVEVDSAAPGTELIVTGDAGRLNQVLSNLAANALRHTPPGGEVTLSARRTSKGVSIQVADSGSGIPAKDIPYIFERFWSSSRGLEPRANPGSVLETHPEGSGLGLAIARQLVQAHGGMIRVESQQQKGTNFIIDLPTLKESWD
jgi:two-component system sensor histidine kinase BaeS